MEDHLVRDVKREATDVKTEAFETEDHERQELPVDTNVNSTRRGVRTVVLQNVQIGENGEDIPIILNNFGDNSDGNLQIDSLEENVIHTYIIE